MRKIGLLLLVLLLSLALFANGNSETSEKTTVVFWHPYGDGSWTGDYMNNVIEEFEALNPDIVIESQAYADYASIIEGLQRAVAADQMPSLVTIGYGYDRYVLNSGKAVPFNAFLEQSTFDDFFEQALAPTVFDGDVYGIPFALSVPVVFYHSELFSEAGLDPDNPPQTLEELFDAWDKLIVKDENGNVTQYAQAIGVRSTVAMIPAFMWLYGADYIDADGNVVINSPEAVECMTMLQEAFAKGVSPVGLTGQEADNLFSAGVASIEWNGPWAYNGFVDAGIDVGVCELPSGVDGRKATIGGDSVLVINKDSKVADAAWAFIEYWNSPDTQRQWSSGTGAPPTRMDMSDDEELLSANPNIAVFLAASENARIFMAGQTLASRFDTEALVPLYESIARGMATPEEALATAEATMNSILGK